MNNAPELRRYVPFAELHDDGTLLRIPTSTGVPDNRIIINAAMPNNPLLQPGKRLNWPEESETKK